MTTNQIQIRVERPGDTDGIRHVVEQAFGRAAEADLVDALRQAGKATLSLVAAQDDRVLGHVLFSPARLDAGDRELSGLGMAPVAVLPEFQRQGIGSRLIGAGLDACRDAGHGWVVVLGHASYYPRFGFVPASRFDIASEFDVPDDVFMIQELQPDTLAGWSGIARYAEEFARF